MKRKIASLTDDLNETNAELAILRRNLSAAEITVQSQLEAKSEEVNDEYFMREELSSFMISCVLYQNLYPWHSFMFILSVLATNCIGER